MHLKDKKILIRFIALVVAGSSLFVLLPHWRSHWHLLFGMPAGVELPGSFRLWMLTVSPDATLVLLLKLVVALGLFLLASWARKIGVWVLIFDFVLRSVLLICVLTNEYAPALEVQKINLWPSNIIAVISLICAIILMLKSSREIFGSEQLVHSIKPNA
jgi:hypothetical protein